VCLLAGFVFDVCAFFGVLYIMLLVLFLVVLLLRYVWCLFYFGVDGWCVLGNVCLMF